MRKNKLNNVIVLKELSSNIVEEAIVVLKPNVDLKVNENTKTFLKNGQIENKRNNFKNKKSENHNTILKEAEFVIEHYISQMQMKKTQKDNDKRDKKYKILKRATLVLILLNFFLLIKLF